MRVLLNCTVPFMLAHGGAQIQIEQTAKGLQRIGVDVDFARWWDPGQQGDVLHHFGRLPLRVLEWAHRQGMRVVIADLLTEQGSRSRRRLARQGRLTRILRACLPRPATEVFHWESYRRADACVALTPWEAELMGVLFGAPHGHTHVVPNGVEDVFLESAPTERGPWLICTATITERKRVLELTRAAAAARTPLWVIGKPYAEGDAYAREFLEVAKANPECIRYEGGINDRSRLARIYREARGFVLLSTMESLSLSALEAAACECPLLLSDLPWARTVFKSGAQYCPVDASASVEVTAAALRGFYDAAPGLPRAERPATWVEIAKQLETVYRQITTQSATR